MMNQMLERELAQQVVSKERLNEIFAVKRTDALWKKLCNHPNYHKAIFDAPLKACEEVEKDYEVTLQQKEELKEYNNLKMQYACIDNAMIICAQQGGTFNQAVQKAIQQLLEVFDEMTEEEINRNVKKAYQMAKATTKILEALF